MNTAIEQCTVNDLGVVVLDELHMIDDEHRGYLMELMATKLLCLQRNVQIIGMSATLSVGAFVVVEYCSMLNSLERAAAGQVA